MAIRIAVTTGEPAGIGPDIFAQLSQTFDEHAEIVAIGDPDLLIQRASNLNIDLTLSKFEAEQYQASKKNACSFIPVTLSTNCEPGILAQENAHYVIETLQTAANLCLSKTCNAICTAPVHKSIINEAGIAFSGHTEFFAQAANIEKVVMMLATNNLRVALVTTHLPLRNVADHITQENVERSLTILNTHLKKFCGISKPHILVAGLNPHAGEGGHLGDEEIKVINPVIEQLKQQGFSLEGSLPADTLFTPPFLERADAILAMYHDQGLPVLKHSGFHNAANITLGLPFIRTSVDHGTALDLAGTNKADAHSFKTALNLAIEMSQQSE